MHISRKVSDNRGYEAESNAVIVPGCFVSAEFIRKVIKSCFMIS